MFRILLKLVCALLFRVRLSGVANLDNAGERVLVVANHLSTIDSLLLSLYLSQVQLLVSSKSSRRKLLPADVRIYYLGGDNDSSGIAAIVKEIQDGRKCLIFPEADVSRTGCLGKIYQAAGMIADKAEATIVPVRVDGTQYSLWSGMGSMEGIAS